MRCALLASLIVSACQPPAPTPTADELAAAARRDAMEASARAHDVALESGFIRALALRDWSEGEGRKGSGQWGDAVVFERTFALREHAPEERGATWSLVVSSWLVEDVALARIFQGAPRAVGAGEVSGKNIRALEWWGGRGAPQLRELPAPRAATSYRALWNAYDEHQKVKTSDGCLDEFESHADAFVFDAGVLQGFRLTSTGASTEATEQRLADLLVTARLAR